MIALIWLHLNGTAVDAADLTPAEQARAEGFGSQRRRLQYLAGRGLLRQVAASLLKVEAGQIVLNAEGRPHCLNQTRPLWLSLSHSGSWAVAAGSTLGPVGVDVEQRDQQRDWAGLAAGLGWTAGEASGPDGFLLRWTLKEALYKAGMDGSEATWQTASEAAVLSLVGPPASPLLWLSVEHPDLKKCAVTI